VRQVAGDNDHLVKAVLDALGHIGEISYDERLSQLVDAPLPGMPDISKWECAAWKARVKEARNGLAHRLPSYPGMPWTGAVATGIGNSEITSLAFDDVVSLGSCYRTGDAGTTTWTTPALQDLY
jgi:hypothetical protein